MNNGNTKTSPKNKRKLLQPWEEDKRLKTEPAKSDNDQVCVNNVSFSVYIKLWAKEMYCKGSTDYPWCCSVSIFR